MLTSKKTSLEQELEDSILAFNHKVMDEMRKEALKLKFTASELEAIRYIAERESPTMKDIAEYLGITPPSVTSIVDALIKKQLVKRELSKSDRRSVKIILAPKAWKLFSTFKDKRLIVLKNLFAKLKSEDKKELIRIISKLI